MPRVGWHEQHGIVADQPPRINYKNMDDHSLHCLDFARIRELLASYALTGLGRSLAENIHPVARETLVKRWLDQVQELQRLVEERGMPPFGGITDVREILRRTGPPLRVTVEEMARVGLTLEGTHAMARWMAEIPDTYPEFRHLAGRVGDFHTIAQRIRSVIDERGNVRDDASPKLRGIRRDIEHASGQIKVSIDKLLRDAGVRRFLQYPNYTFHGDRLVLPVRSENRGRVQGIVHRTSDSGATLYVEPAAVVELNNQISNLRSEEQEEIGRVLWELTHEVHLNEASIRKTLDTLAVIDLVVAKIRFAKAFELRCPALAAEGTLNVRNARHPLLVDINQQKRAAGQTPDPVVPIDYRIGHDFHLVIVTGPNTGGKTVTLKTIGLLSLMVQAGVPIPVDRHSEIGVFSNILIDVGDEQSMQQSLSTFSAHLTRILDMLRHAGPRALLLIDELGAGTDPDEGAALGRAILDEMLRLKCRGVVTTHLGALKGFALTRKGAENACVDFDPETLRPTYHLLMGEPGHSNAIDVAQRLGMSKRMVAAARRNVSHKAKALHQALESTRVVKREAERARKQAEEAQVNASKAESAAQAARTEYERRREDFQQWVQRVVHLQPGDAVRVRNFDRDGKIVRLRIEQHRAEVDVGAFSVEVPLGDVLPPQAPPPPPRAAKPEPPASAKGKPAGRGRTQRPRAKTPTHGNHGGGGASKPRPAHTPRSLSDQEVEALQPGDSVYVKRFRRAGRVVRVLAAKKHVIVNAGLLEVEVPYDGLGPVHDHQPASGKSGPATKQPSDQPEHQAVQQDGSSAKGVADRLSGGESAR